MDHNTKATDRATWNNASAEDRLYLDKVQARRERNAARKFGKHDRRNARRMARSEKEAWINA